MDYEELPAVFDAETALQGRVLIHPTDADYQDAPGSWGRQPNVQSWVTLQHGDVEHGMAEADRVIEHVFRTEPVHQGYIEPHAYFVRADASGQVQLSLPNKMPMRSRELLAQLIDLPEDAIDIHPSYIGGDFGGKGSLMDLPAVVYLARRTRRPVKYVMRYAEELTAANPRHSGVIRIKSGLRSDGTLLARQATLLWDAGAYGGFKPSPDRERGRSPARRQLLTFPTTRSTSCARTPIRCHADTRVRRAHRSATSPRSRTWTCWRTRWAWTRWSSG